MNKGPPPSYEQPAPAGFPQPATVIVTQNVVTPVGTTSASMVCPFCRQNIMTQVVSEANTKTHMFALLLCLFGCWPCVCIPYCMDSCQSQRHNCPNCGAFLGEYQN